MVLGSALLHASWSVSIKGSSDPLGFNLLQCWVALASLLAIAPFVEFAEVPRAVWGLLATTGVSHGLYFYWMSRAYEEGDLSLVYPIARSTPAFLPLVAVPLFGDPLSVGGAAGIAVVVAGIWLVHGGGLARARLAEPAARFAFLTLAATVAYSLLDAASMRRLAEASWTSPIPRAIVFSVLLSVANLLLFMPLVLRRRSLGALRAIASRELGRATLAAGVSFASYTLILAALQTAPVSYVVAVRQSSVLFAVVLGILLLGERPGRARVVGAIFTVAGVALIARWS
jgi:drug/metabolite transporter (DMT)-like permease